jgi:tRNA (mo5U34)-methyltransferase
MTPEEIKKRVDDLAPWFHYIDIGNGIVTKSISAVGEPLTHPLPTWEKLKACLPSDLGGKSLLDVGCNAGFYAIEAKRRGAERVLGVDAQRNLIRQAEFVRSVLGLDIQYEKLTVYDLDPRQHGQFDVTLALGLVYHCKHLVLALEKLFTITRSLLLLETAVYPPKILPPSATYEVGGVSSKLHPIGYVENSPDAKEAIYNWFLPSVPALKALLLNVGFDEVEVFEAAQDDRTILACRKRAPYPDSRAITYLAADLTLVDGPVTSAPNDVLRFTISATNSGNARWLKEGETGTDRGAVHLVAHVLNLNGDPISWYHAGAFLPSDIQPGETVEIEILMRAPEHTGRFLVEFDMLAEHIAWFDDLGSRVLRHELLVT